MSFLNFAGRPHCDILLNNMCEVFNKQLVNGRDVPIITSLEFVMEYLMKRIVNVQILIQKSNGPLTPAATALFKQIEIEVKANNVEFFLIFLFCLYLVLLMKYFVMKFEGNMEWWTQAWGVKGPWDDQVVVDVQKRTCSCRKWELRGMLCKHALATIWEMDVNNMEVGTPESWVHRAY
jgi:hypothetical protein